MGEAYFRALHQSLEQQYAPCDCEACRVIASEARQSIPLSLGEGQGVRNFSKVEKAGLEAFKKLHERGTYNPKDLSRVKEYKNLVSETSNAFNFAISHEVPDEMKAYLEKDGFIFSGLKTHAQLTEARSYLKDQGGNIIPYHQFEQKILKLNEKYNRHYLEAEYEFAVQSSQSAANWANLQTNTARYWLEYRTAGDERVRASHAALNGTCLPADDDFWNSYYPPNGWRCRCVAVEVLARDYKLSDSTEAIKKGEKATTQIGKSGKNKLEMFRFNPGKELKLFPPKNAYTKVVGAEKVNNDTSKYDKDILEYWSSFADDFEKTSYYKNAKQINSEIRTAETLAIYMYTLDFYDRINEYLRKDRQQPRDFFDKYTEVCNSGLDKMKSFEGTVYRGADLKRDDLKNYKEALKNGTPHIEKAYTSTSKNKSGAFNRNTFYEIKSKTGKFIEPLSEYEHEAEVLFKEGTQFKIISIEKNGYQHKIVMEEI